MKRKRECEHRHLFMEYPAQTQITPIRVVCDDCGRALLPHPAEAAVVGAAVRYWQDFTGPKHDEEVSVDSLFRAVEKLQKERAK